MNVTARLATDEESWQKRQLFLLKKMDSYRRKGVFADVTLRCGKHTFPAQKLALSVRSQYFAGMFLTGCFPDVRDVNLDVSEAAMRELLQFMYTDRMSLSTHVTVDTFKQILTAADNLKIDGAIHYVFNKLSQKKLDDLILVMWDWAESNNSEDLIHKITEYIFRNMTVLKRGHTFLTLTPSHWETLLEKACRYFKVYDDILQAFLMWVKADQDHRKTVFSSLLPKIPFQKVSTDYLIHLKFKEPLLENVLNVLFTEMSDEEMTKYAFSVISRRKKKFTRAQRSPISHQPLYTKTGLTFQEKPVEDLKTESQSSASPKSIGSTGRSESTEEQSPISLKKALNMSGLAVLAIGFNDLRQMEFYLYLASLSQWTTPYNLEMPHREKLMMIHDKGKLYMFGGETDNCKMADTHIFHPSTRLLHEGPTMTFARCSAGVACHRNQVYVIGGMSSNDQILTSVEVLNAKTDTWQDAKPTNQKHVNPGIAVTSSGLLYVVGGLTTSIEYYNPDEDSWTNICHLPDLCRKVAMFGGYAEQHIYAVSYFNPVPVCCIKTSNNELEVVRTTGRPPEQIVNLITIGKDLWVLDAKGRFYCCDLNAYRWDKTTVCCPKTIQQPVYSALVSLKRL